MMITEQEIVATLRAVDVATEPVNPTAWPALADPDARQEIDQRLRAAGRQLVAVRDTTHVDQHMAGYLTGWDDTTADAMLAAGSNPLSVAERAVLALVLLHSVAIPQASGLIPPRGLREAAPFDPDLLWDRPDADEQGLGKEVVASAVRVLEARGLVTSRPLRPGPAFDHLGPVATERIWRNLLVLARPSWARFLASTTGTGLASEHPEPTEKSS
jgi:hypothetical protein